MFNRFKTASFTMLLAGVAMQAFTVQAVGASDSKNFKELAPHPRLFVSRAQLERAVKGRGDEYADIYEDIEAAAETGLHDLDEPLKGMSDHSRSFKVQGRLMSLAIQWHRTKDRRYLEGALKTVKQMEEWLDFGHEFILWHGQYIAGIAITYDLLYNDLTPQEREWFVSFARDHCIKPFLSVTGRKEEGQRGSWWQYIVSNWNPVCNSGPGMLALAMYEDLDDAQTVIDRVNSSFDPIISYLQETEGGWVEGLGYWNWTIHYMSLFYMSYERSTGEKHKGFRSDGFRDTLTFGSYFAPHAEPCGFGDNQHGGVDSSVLAAAEYLGYENVLKELQNYRRRQADAIAHKKKLREEKRGKPEAKPGKEDRKVVNISYGECNKLLIEPDILEGLHTVAVTNMVRSFPKQGWAMVADKWPRPNVYASIRGGLLGGPHTHLDLMSWNGVIGIERMILNYNKAGYYETSWQQRAWEIYERGSQSKNTLFIGGLGPYRETYKRGVPEGKITEYVTHHGPMVRLDATSAYWLTRKDPKLVARGFLVVGDKGLLVMDRILGRGYNPVEVRTHTDKKATFGKSDVLIEGEFETARMTFACDAPALLRRATAMLTDARAVPPTVMRWQTRGSVRDVAIASFLSRGEDPVTLTVKSSDGVIEVVLQGKDWKETLKFNNNLTPLDAN